MPTIFKNINKKLDFNYEYSSASISSALSITSSSEYFPKFNYKGFKPKYVLRELDCVSDESDDSWFMESDWLEGEVEADKDIQEGRCFKFENVQDTLSFLAKQR